MILTDKDAKPLTSETDQFKTVELHEKYLNLSVPNVPIEKTKRIVTDSTIRQSPGTMLENGNIS